MDLEAIFRTIDTLSEEEKKQVITYILHQQTPPEPPKKRIFDLHRGAIIMSEDFDDELPDSFWLGDE